MSFGVRFEAEPHEHRVLADQHTSETRKCLKADGRTVDLWTKKLKSENHRFETLKLCAVGTAELGVKRSGIQRTHNPQRTIKAAYPTTR